MRKLIAMVSFVAIMVFLCTGIGMAAKTIEIPVIVTHKVKKTFTSKETGRKISEWTEIIVQDKSAKSYYRYYLLDSTEIYNSAGKKISIESLMVPCDAVLQIQQLKRMQGNVLKIRVKKVLEGASKNEADLNDIFFKEFLQQY